MIVSPQIPSKGTKIAKIIPFEGTNLSKIIPFEGIFYYLRYIIALFGRGSVQSFCSVGNGVLAVGQDGGCDCT